MFTIKISDLNPLFQVNNSNFFPIVDSGSHTTFETTFNTVSNWISSSVTSSASTSSISASYALTASYAILSRTASNLIYNSISNGTASYAITALHADTASYLNLSEHFAYNSEHALTASFALTAPLEILELSAAFANPTAIYSISASHTITASYSISGSKSISSSFAIFSSHTITASYASNIPSLTQNSVPLCVKNLTVIPSNLYSGLTMNVIASEVIMWDAITKYIKIQDINETATLTPTSYNVWYDLYLIYNETTKTISTVYSSQLSNPRDSLEYASIYFPNGYSYYKLIGSVYPLSSNFIERYMEYGNKTKFHYRKAMSGGEDYLLNSGNLYHNLGNYPDKMFLKFYKYNNTLTPDGWRQGDIILHDEYNFFTQIYMENAQTDGYEDYPAYLMHCPDSQTINIHHTMVANDQNLYYFDSLGQRFNSWAASSGDWMAWVTVETYSYPFNITSTTAPSTPATYVKWKVSFTVNASAITNGGCEVQYSYGGATPGNADFFVYATSGESGKRKTAYLCLPSDATGWSITGGPIGTQLDDPPVLVGTACIP